jgi:DNA-binding LacI/PurR family transcriptional regulator
VPNVTFRAYATFPAWTDPPLTTLDLSHEAAARQMVLMLERMIDGVEIPPEQRRVKIQPRLIVREST